MNFAVLLEAAEFIERKEREMEHGYAITAPMPVSRNNSHHSHGVSRSGQRTRKLKSKPHNNRTTHNELEKNRRAHLRTCLEKLKDMVPLGSDGSRHTTLGLLTKAKHFISNLEDHEKQNRSQKEMLRKEQVYLKRRVDHLEKTREFASKRRSVSESSVQSTSSTSSSSSNESIESCMLLASSICESDEIDILEDGCSSSSSSDSDVSDQSVQSSSSSDGGVAIFTRRLTIGETGPAAVVA